MSNELKRNGVHSFLGFLPIGEYFLLVKYTSWQRLTE